MILLKTVNVFINPTWSNASILKVILIKWPNQSFSQQRYSMQRDTKERKKAIRGWKKHPLEGSGSKKTGSDVTDYILEFKIVLI